MMVEDYADMARGVLATHSDGAVPTQMAEVERGLLVGVFERGGAKFAFLSALNLWRRDWWRRKGTGGGDHGF